MTKTVAIAQVDPALGDVKTNVEFHLEQIERARAAGCDLLVFPELSLTGYDLGQQVSEVALKDGDPELTRLLAATGSMVVVVGCVWEQRPAVFTNASLVVQDGEILARHDKVYLPNYGPYEEAKWFSRGDRVAAVDTRAGRLGVAICEESWHVSVPYLIWLDGAEVLVFQTAGAANPDEVDSPSGSAATCRLQNRFYARMLGAFVLFANRVGREGDFVFWGGSEVVTPTGEIAGQAARFEPDFLVSTLDLERVRQARIALPLWRDEDRWWTWRQLRRFLQ